MQHNNFTVYGMYVRDTLLILEGNGGVMADGMMRAELWIN